MADGTDCPGKDKEIGRGDGSARLSGYVTSEDVDAGRYKPLRAGVSLQYANREPRFYASLVLSWDFRRIQWRQSYIYRYRYQKICEPL